LLTEQLDRPLLRSLGKIEIVADHWVPTGIYTTVGLSPESPGSFGYEARYSCQGIGPPGFVDGSKGSRNFYRVGYYVHRPVSEDFAKT
jgi:hypothetical protein